MGITTLTVFFLHLSPYLNIVFYHHYFQMKEEAKNHALFYNDFIISMFSQFLQLYIKKMNGYFSLYLKSMNTSIRLKLGTKKAL